MNSFHSECTHIKEPWKIPISFIINANCLRHVFLLVKTLRAREIPHRLRAFVPLLEDLNSHTSIHMLVHRDSYLQLQRLCCPFWPSRAQDMQVVHVHACRKIFTPNKNERNNFKIYPLSNFHTLSACIVWYAAISYMF